MKLITRNTDYAVRALCFISGKKNETVPVSDLVGALKVPRPFLRKILQELQKHHVLSSFRGAGGGFRLSAGPERIFLKDIMRIFQGEFILNECTLKKGLCPNTRVCGLKKKIDAIEAYASLKLKPITIKSLC